VIVTGSIRVRSGVAVSNQIAYTIPSFDRTPINELNPEKRCPCVLLLDVSGSMSAGGKLAEMETGVREFKAAILEDSHTSKRVEVAVITFGGESARVVTDFVGARDFEPPNLVADGLTPMGAAIHAAIDLVAARKRDYRASRPMASSGERRPTGSMRGSRPPTRHSSSMPSGSATRRGWTSSRPSRSGPR